VATSKLKPNLLVSQHPAAQGKACEEGQCPGLGTARGLLWYSLLYWALPPATERAAFEAC